MAPYLHQDDLSLHRQARVGRLPARRRDPARRRRPPGARRRPPRARVLPAHGSIVAAARHRLRLRPADAARRLRPPALARRRLDRLLPAVGRRRRCIRRWRALDQPRPGARSSLTPLPARPAHLRVADGPADRHRPRSSRRRPRLHRRPRRVDHPVRARRRSHGRARPPAGPLARARARAQRRGRRARRRHDPRRRSTSVAVRTAAALASPGASVALCRPDDTGALRVDAVGANWDIAAGRIARLPGGWTAPRHAASRRAPGAAPRRCAAGLPPTHTRVQLVGARAAPRRAPRSLLVAGEARRLQGRARRTARARRPRSHSPSTARC